MEAGFTDKALTYAQGDQLPYLDYTDVLPDYEPHQVTEEDIRIAYSKIIDDLQNVRDVMSSMRLSTLLPNDQIYIEAVNEAYGFIDSITNSLQTAINERRLLDKNELLFTRVDIELLHSRLHGAAYYLKVQISRENKPEDKENLISILAGISSLILLLSKYKRFLDSKSKENHEKRKEVREFNTKVLGRDGEIVDAKVIAINEKVITYLTSEGDIVFENRSIETSRLKPDHTYTEIDLESYLNPETQKANTQES